MKKLFLLFGTITILSFSFIGCGDKEERMTEEEINARVDSIFGVESAKLTEEMTLQCAQRLESEVSMRADQLVVRATTDTAALMTEDATTDITVDTATEPVVTTDTETAEELTDEEIIRNRVDEKLTALRTELEMQCEQQLMAASRTRADSILNAQGSSANLPPVRRSTGTNTGKNTTPSGTATPGNRAGTEQEAAPGNRAGTKDAQEATPGNRAGTKKDPN